MCLITLKTITRKNEQEMKIIRDWVQWLRDYEKGGDIVRRPGWWQQSRLIEETEINIKKKKLFRSVTMRLSVQFNYKVPYRRSSYKQQAK